MNIDARFKQELVAAKHRLAAALPDAAAWQRRLLTEILRDNADTAFGKEHGFHHIRTIDDYRAAVPLRTHEEPPPRPALPTGHQPLGAPQPRARPGRSERLRRPVAGDGTFLGRPGDSPDPDRAVHPERLAAAAAAGPTPP
ncbi:GH3 auxin-responsive promoter family protein [Streptomyces sp. NPDC020845]|uniref:GH3 family domain-containing protein n=1 Tax=Streptomyces sp. NPDC020845 TaxID=3365096 RepID=UPI0037B7D99A